MLFGCVVWGHMFEVCFLLSDGLQGSCIKLGVLYHSALHWAVATPLHICRAALYLFCYTISLHGLVSKQMVRYFASLEDELQCFELLAETSMQAIFRWPRWAASFVRAATEEVELHCSTA